MTTQPPANVAFVVTNDWGTGFTADLTIRNIGTTPINGWTLNFNAPYTIDQHWSSLLTKLPDGRYSVKPLSWNTTIPAGGSITFGFRGVKAAGTPATAPTNYQLNGISLTSGSAPTPILPELTISDATLAEGALNTQGAAAALFQVSLSKASSQTVTVSYATRSGSAIAGQDFTAQQGTLTFAPGQTTKTLAIPIINDTLVEPTETFKLILSNAAGATLGKSEGTGTLLDNDVAPTFPTKGKFNYAEALQKSFLFYEAQRSGDLPTHNRIQWRGDSALRDGSDVGRDLTGGYHDAGDHVKFNFPMAASLTLLSWGAREYGDAYSRVGQLDEALDAIRWGTDYLLKCHVTDANGTKEFWGQVGNGSLDHAYWGAPEKMTMARPAYKIDRQRPGSDLAGEAAAALASASIVFRKTDVAYADKLLTNAIQLYTFADTYRGKYSDAIPDAQSFYNSWSGYQDELAWGAAWIHEALQAAGKSDTTYLTKAKAAYTGVHAPLSWDNKSAGVGVLLAQETGESRYRNDVERMLDSWLPGGSGVTYTPGGLAWSSQWGSLRYAANMAFVAGVYADTVTNPQGKYSTFAEKQIDYILGDNPRQASYVVGFGKNSPVNPHHRAASGTDWSGFHGTQPNAHILYGALVGGPSAANDFAYKDLRSDYISNEVATDYNAAFTGAMARMVNRFGGTPLSDAQLDALPGIVVQSTPALI
jgi:hypothetical protein